MSSTIDKVANAIYQQLPSFGGEKPSNVDPIPWTDPAVEPPVDREIEMVEELKQVIHKVQKKNFALHRHGMRATHVKTQGIVKGTLSVNDNLPPHLAQGLFKQPGTYDVAARYANEPSFLQDDRTPGPRGLGMKVFGVEGEFLDPIGERTKTQDFTFNNAPMLELTDLPTTLEIFKIREHNFDDHDNLKKELKKRKDYSLQTAPATLPNVHPMSFTMYSQSAYRWGEYVAKYALFPSSSLQQVLDQENITKDSDPQVISQMLQSFFANHTAKYDFRVQLLREPSRQSVEDCSKPWSESAFPFETVGRVVFPAGQDPFAAERRIFWDDHMKLNVWYGLEEHRPLGSVNRLRKKLYQMSSSYREEMNAAEVKEVSSVEEIP